MKHLQFLQLAACTLMLALVVGCATPPAGSSAATPMQQAIDATNVSYHALDAAILAADAAVKTNTLKGQDAVNAVKAMTTAKAALDVTLATLQSAQAMATPASGAKP
jgi:hypothetical protein